MRITIESTVVTVSARVEPVLHKEQQGRTVDLDLCIEVPEQEGLRGAVTEHASFTVDPGSSVKEGAPGPMDGLGLRLADRLELTGEARASMAKYDDGLRELVEAALSEAQ